MADLGPLSNQTLGNKYLLGELLGEGGFGVVYNEPSFMHAFTDPFALSFAPLFPALLPGLLGQAIGLRIYVSVFK